MGSTQSELLIVSQLSDKLDLDLFESTEHVEFDLLKVVVLLDFCVEAEPLRLDDLSSFGKLSPLHIQSWISLDPRGIHLRQVDVRAQHSEQFKSESSDESSTPEPEELNAPGLIAPELRGDWSKGSTMVSVKYDESLSSISETICSLSRVLLHASVGYKGSCLGDLGGVGSNSNFFQISSDGAGAS